MDWLSNWNNGCKHECPQCKCKVVCTTDTCTGHKQMYCNSHSLVRNMTYKPYGSSPYSYQNEQQYQQQLKAAAGMSQTAGQLINSTISANTFGIGGATSGGLIISTTTPIVNGTFTVQVPSNFGVLKPRKFNLGIIKKLEDVEPKKLANRVPDSVVPITAWRAWKANDTSGELRLDAIGVSTTWEPKKRISATCCKEAAIVHSQHQAPCKGCSCGVWGFKTKDELLRVLDGYNANVIGTVSMWGRVIETTVGFRAQYAYPSELWLLEDGLEDLSLIYNVPIRAL